ncbi:MAG TPA: hypothetical protein VMC02_02085 [Steroidobacteraceae bacterium]|nr:hypothetical protein [Steroidobacteraceae bacterium]
MAGGAGFKGAWSFPAASGGAQGCSKTVGNLCGGCSQPVGARHNILGYAVNEIFAAWLDFEHRRGGRISRNLLFLKDKKVQKTDPGDS